ncbi:cupin domain-containing protein [Lacimicrobium sp. SS2-24]|uniref:cupin domain-containing protein n=1 Tax=Lacimicrobium sp. SS2-24 TaxID=2005569 RepID=UPI000B4B6C8A|nr:cupin domain-containing protein [Lacimicrobium sp. SS2-24]
MFRFNLTDPQTFLEKHWQKQPLLLKGAFTDFTDPLDEHDLAGLAQEPDIDARIVSSAQQRWQVHQGPFTEEDFGCYCKGQWSLLVQGVDRYLDAATELLNTFDFIPSWRVEDLMVSFSVPGGGVGPHIDQYDVFIIQGKGARRWQVGGQGGESLRPHPLLSQVSTFEPVIDVVLQPGDVLYIPPGFAHCGETIQDSLNYSVGFRAPNQAELISDFADFVLDNAGHCQRYTDPQRTVPAYRGQVTQQDQNALRSLMKQAIDSPLFEPWLGRFLSQQGEVEPEPLDISFQTLKRHVLGGLPLFRSLSCKGAWLETDESEPLRQLHFGDWAVNFDARLQPWVDGLLEQSHWYYPQQIEPELSDLLLHLLHQLVGAGLWHLHEN